MQNRKILIAPSLLACNFAIIEAEVRRCLDGGADLLHLDVMDGHFVPNLSFGVPIIKVVSQIFPELKLDVHLMVTNPEDYVDPLAELGVYQVSFHWEATRHPHRLLTALRERGVKAGLAFNPHSPVEQARYVSDLVDCYLIMTVNPGFGGQSFLHSQLPKVSAARKIAEQQDREVSVCVDGGVDDITAPLCRNSGADVLVAGSYLFQAASMALGIASLRGPAR